MKQALDETSAEDDRLLSLLDTSHQKVIKPLSETRMHNGLLGEEFQLGERVASFKENIDTVEAEIASLWDQWNVAQKEVDDIFAALAEERAGEAGSIVSVRDSLAREMDKLEEELNRILEDAHEEARVSEKVCTVHHAIIRLLADFITHLGFQQEDQGCQVRYFAAIFLGMSGSLSRRVVAISPCLQAASMPKCFWY